MGTKQEKSNADVIQAAGGLVWRDSQRGKEVAVIHRKRYGDWTLPKGKLKPGERWQEAAIREVKEETGCNVKLKGFADIVSYEVGGIPKIVLFWNMISLGECNFVKSEEVEDVVWLTVDKALERLDYPGERHLLECNKRDPVIKLCNSQWWSPFVAFVPWIDARSANRNRLVGEIFAIEKELNWLKEKTETFNSCWAKSSGDMLNKAKDALNCNEVELGWRCLNIARSMYFLGLDALNDENLRKAKARVIWEEANNKLGSWRKQAVKDILFEHDDFKSNISGSDIFQAHRILSEYYENQFFKIAAFERHLFVLVLITTLAIASFIILTPAQSNDLIKAPDRVFVTSIIIFGIMGAVVSGMLSAKGGTEGRIPEQQISHTMIFAKLAVGAISALATYVFITSNLINIKLGGNGDLTPPLILAASFAAGFTERLVSRAVETVVKNDSKK
jgi:8-oxo-dGTP diphosphatase